MDLRSKLSYANVTATLALFLVLAGGTVYAATEIGRNDVKSKNIAKGAVKTSDVAAQAVSGAKVKEGTITGANLQDGTITAGDIQNGTITGEDLVAGLIPQIDADIAGSATGGPQAGITTAASTPVPLTGTTSVTPNAGDLIAVAAEAQFTLASTTAGQFCSPAVRLLVNGKPSRVFASPEDDVDTTTTITTFGRDAAGPYGLLDPGTPLEITAQLQGDIHCTAASQLDRLTVSIVQIR